MVNCKKMIIFFYLSKFKLSSKLIVLERGDGFKKQEGKIYTKEAERITFGRYMVKKFLRV